MEYKVKTQTGLPRKDGQVSKTKVNYGKIVSTGLLSLVLSLAFGVSGQFVYNFYRYDPFIVDGESMYPILNYDTKITYADGTTFEDPKNTWSKGDFNSTATYICDYCLMDTKKGFEKTIERFDIAITYYASDYDSDGKLKDAASLKVKRVIGLPGETIKFDVDGSLYIRGTGEIEYTYVDQYFLTYEYNKNDRPLVDESWYELARKETTNGKVITYTLLDDEYYLVGDNRRLGASLDSRSTLVGAIKESYLVGKAITKLSKCSYIPGQKPKVLFRDYILPWRLKEL